MQNATACVRLLSSNLLTVCPQDVVANTSRRTAPFHSVLRSSLYCATSSLKHNLHYAGTRATFQRNPAPGQTVC